MNSTGQGTEAAEQLRGLTGNLDAAPCPLPAAASEASQASVMIRKCEEEGMFLPSFSAAGGAQPLPLAHHHDCDAVTTHCTLQQDL